MKLCQVLRRGDRGALLHPARAAHLRHERARDHRSHGGVVQAEPGPGRKHAWFRERVKIEYDEPHSLWSFVELCIRFQRIAPLHRGPGDAGAGLQAQAQVEVMD